MIEHLLTTILTYLIDAIFGEFRFERHPVTLIGDLITSFKRRFYASSILRGSLPVLFTLLIVSGFATIFQIYLNYLPEFTRIIVTALFASAFVTHKTLKDRLRKLVETESFNAKKEAIAKLVNRNMQEMNENKIYKTAVEIYAQKLNDCVVAPLFYLYLFGLPGIMIYKTVNTLDSMIAHKNERYEKFGKIAAKLDDIANYIPARLTALLIMLKGRTSPLFAFYKDGKKHEKANIGFPVAAMALVLNVKLGDNISSFGKGRETITKEDVLEALSVI